MPPATTPTHPPEQANLGPTTQGSVLLDIGGSIGALVIITPASMAGTEIEISPLGHDHTRSHVAVRERRGDNGVVYAAVFFHLPAAAYTVWHHDGVAAAQVTITGGEVNHLDWQTPRPAGQ